MAGKKHNIPMIAAIILLTLTMITTHMTGGLFARYTTTASGSDSARVAKFDVKCEVKNVNNDTNTANYDPNENQVTVLVTNYSEVAVKYRLEIVSHPEMNATVDGQPLTDALVWTLEPVGGATTTRTHSMTFDIVNWQDITKEVNNEASTTKTVDFTVHAIAEQIN